MSERAQSGAKCPTCNGSGDYEWTEYQGDQGTQRVMSCGDCGGTGERPQVGTAPAEEELQIIGYRYFYWSPFNPGRPSVRYDCGVWNGQRPWGSQPLYVRASEEPAPPALDDTRTVAGTKQEGR